MARSWHVRLLPLAATWALMLCSFLPLVQGSDALHCFELPIVIVSPIQDRLPHPDCNQKRLPSPDCMKRPVESHVEVIDNPVGEGQSASVARNCLDGERTDVYRSKVHYRGSSSLRFGKHQLTAKMKENVPFLGFPPDRSYVLNGPYVDSSLLRNHLAHWIFRATGRYSPRTRHIVLFIRNSLNPNDLKPQYKGIYLAMEHISYGPHRVALATLNSSCQVNQINGGWAWQFNPLNYGVYSPNTPMDDYQNLYGNGERSVLMSPPARVLTQSMRDYFVDTRTGPLPLLYRYLFHNMTQPDDLEAHLEIGSYVDYFLHTEMSQNQDAYRRSAYFFKDRDQPINAGPVWDLNLAYGVGAHSNPEGWIYPKYMFWKRMFCNYRFTGLVAKRWRQLRASVWSDETIESFIENSSIPLKRQLEKCAHWWGDGLQCAHVSPDTSGPYEEKVNFLKDAVVTRAKWMDENIAKFYTHLDSETCGPGSPLPAYNCASDGDDAGCIEDPEAYIEKVDFPAVRVPFQGPSCEPQPNSISVAERPNIDPCWFSTGTYITAGELTPFCSGYGECPPGPGATCKCRPGHHPPTCARNDTSFPSMTDFELIRESECGAFCHVTLIFKMSAFGCCVLALAMWIRNRHARQGYQSL